MPSDDDPTRAAVRVAESVVELVRAEVGLVAARARATGSRVALTVLWSAAATFLSALAVVVVVLFPMLFAYRPSAAIGTLALALALALVAMLVTVKRWRNHSRTNAAERTSISPVHDLPGSDHAIPR